MQISSAAKLMAGTTAQVRFTTPLGEDYIAMYPPAKPTTTFLGAGATLPLADTGAAPSVEDAFAALSLLLNGGGISQIATIIRELDKTITGRTGTIRSVIIQAHKLVSALNAHKADIDSALVGVHNLALTLGAGDDVIDKALDEFPTAIKVVAGQTTQLNSLLTHVGRLSTVTTNVLNQTTDKLLGVIQNLKPALDSLAGVRGQLVPTMNKLVAFGSAIDKAAPGDYLTANGTLDLVFSDTGILPPSSAYSSSSGAASGQAATTTLLTGGLGR
jgi:phospholipid/cholesterol/gamma-HCH transport system substrate-binding protein